MVEFFNLSKKIVQRSEFKGARTQFICRPEQRPADRLIDRHAQRVRGTSVDCPVDRSKEQSTEVVHRLAWPTFCWTRSTDR